MRSAWYDRLGKAVEVLEVGDVETPTPGPGEVRVRVTVSGVNPVDVKRRAGGRGAQGDARIVPHFDGAGTIDAVGDGVSPKRVGQRVWIYEAQWQRNAGTAAEFVSLPQDLAIPLPGGASFTDGASLGIPALTAHQCVFGDGSVDGQTVLVTGGAGAVGSYAVQFAALEGARVIATVSGPEKAAIATASGADAVVNYRTESVRERVLELTDGEGVDRIVEVDFGGNVTECVEILKRHAVISTYASAVDPEPTVPFYLLLYRNITVRHELVFLMTDEAKAAAIADLDRWMSEGRLVHPEVTAFPLDQIVDAHEAVEQGAVGKVVIAFE
jgi:NADPH2:quinone reductase